MAEAKSYEISQWDVVKSFELVKNLQGNLYKISNRMSSGSYFSPPVRTVDIPKGDGKTRTLGIPTVEDRVAQQVVKMQLEPLVEPLFHKDSYGYRRGTKQAIRQQQIAHTKRPQHVLQIGLFAPVMPA